MVSPRSAYTRHHDGSTSSFHDTTLREPAHRREFTIYFTLFVPFSIPPHNFPFTVNFLPLALPFLPLLKSVTAPRAMFSSRKQASSRSMAANKFPLRALPLEPDSAYRTSSPPCRFHALSTDVIHVFLTAKPPRRRAEGSHRHPRGVPKSPLHPTGRNARNQNRRDHFPQNPPTLRR